MPPRWTALLRSPWPRLMVFGMLLGVFGVLALTSGADATRVLRGWADSLGPWGAVLFAFGYAVATVMLLPGSVLSAAAGALFGPVLGIGVVFAGAVFGAMVSFRIGRVLGRDGVQRLAGGRIDRLNDVLRRHGAMAILLVRLVPLFPFALINYGFAVTSIGPIAYLTGTAVGIAPGAIAYVVLGDHITDPTSVPFLVAAGVLLILTVAGALAARRLDRRTPETPKGN